MNENAKKAQAVINDLAKYKVGQVVFWADTFADEKPYVQAGRIDHAEIDTSRTEFEYYAESDMAIDYENNIAASLEELKAKKIAALEDAACAYEVMPNISESVRKRQLAHFRKAIKTWQSVTEDDVEYLE